MRKTTSCSSLWEEAWKTLDEDLQYCGGALSHHPATLHHDDVAIAGAPARPLEFPAPLVYDCALVNSTALDHRTGQVHEVKNVITRKCAILDNDCGNSSAELLPPKRAYLMQKKLSKSVYGSVRLCVVLKEKRKLNNGSYSHAEKLFKQQQTRFREEHQLEAKWESTEELVVLKASSWGRIRQLRGRHLEDPIREIAALQHIGNYHPHVLGCIEVLQDDKWLYTITPYCSGGHLIERVSLSGGCGYSPFASSSGRDRGVDDATISTYDNSTTCTEDGTIDESKVRHWFKQLLLGLFHLQRKGVCHRDISLENLMLDENDNLVIIDFGLSLRIPYNSDPASHYNLGNGVTDVSEGICRRLMKSQGQGGNRLMYTAPEISEAFDGHAIDLWSAGVVLFVLLVGAQPFDWAHTSDKRYEMIANGKLSKIIKAIGGSSFSEKGCDLLQNMMWRNPRDRLTLSDVMRHPWVCMDNNKENVTIIPGIDLHENKNELKNKTNGKNQQKNWGKWATSVVSQPKKSSTKLPSQYKSFERANSKRL